MRGKSARRTVYHSDFPVRPEKDHTWWTDDIISEVVLTPLLRDGELAKATHVSCDLADGEPIRSIDALFEASKTWRDLSVVAIYAGDFQDPTWKLHLRFATSGPCVGMQIAEDPEGAYRKRFAKWLGEWSRRFDRFGCDLGVGVMSAVDLPYPRPRPPRQGTSWPLGSLELYLGRRWHEAADRRKDVFARVSEAPLAAGVHRVVADDVLRVSFECDLCDDASIERACVLSERWLTPLVPTNVEPGWNELGDQKVVVIDAIDRQPFTLYDEYKQVGYCAVGPDSGDDDMRWQRLSEIARAGVLDDGTVVKSVRLIAPSREEAVALVDRATADGFEMVTYPGGESYFWRVWREP